MYTYKPRTVAEIRTDLRNITAEIARAHDDDLPDLQDDRESLFDELNEALDARPAADKYATTGLDLIRVIKAFGGIPSDWDK